jgi:hypothetical protein
MKLKNLTAAIGISVGLSCIAGVSNASLLAFEDDDIDFHLRADGQGDLQLESGAFAVGDVLAAVFEIPVYTIDGANAIPTGLELTGVSAIQIASLGAGGAGSASFNPYSGGLNEVLGLGTSGASVADGGAGGGAMIAMWLNGTSGAAGDRDLDLNRASNPATNCTSLSDCITQASLGSLFQVDGFAGDPDELWTSGGIIPAGAFDSSIVAGIANTTIVAGFNAKISNFFQDGFDIAFQDALTGASCGSDLGYVADGCVQFSVSGTISGGVGLSNGAFAHSDFDADKITVPEPGSLSLLGLSLIGLGYASRKQSAAKA